MITGAVLLTFGGMAFLITLRGLSDALAVVPAAQKRHRSPARF